MSELAVAPEVVRPASGLTALLRHTRYVLAGNPVTGFAAGLFLLIVIAAVFGSWIVPYDPYASNTAIINAAPGKKAIHHSPETMKAAPSATMIPHSAVGGRTPSPMNERPAALRMA